MQKRIAALFEGNPCVHAVPRDDERVVGKDGQLLQGVHQRRHIPAREIGAPDRAGEERVAGEEQVQRFGCLGGLEVWEVVANPARSMTGCFNNLQTFQTFQTFQAFQTSQRFRPYERGVLRRELVQRMADHRHILLVDADGEVWKSFDETRNAADVVEVRVGQENRRGFKALFREQVGDTIGLLPRIDDPRLSVFTQDRAVHPESANLYRKSFHKSLV